MRKHPADYPLEVSGSPITPVMYNAVGGSTVHFCAQWVRLRPQDYKLRTLHGLADDWPISYEEMKPYYERIDQEMLLADEDAESLRPYLLELFERDRDARLLQIFFPTAAFNRVIGEAKGMIREYLHRHVTA